MSIYIYISRYLHPYPFAISLRHPWENNQRVRFLFFLPSSFFFLLCEVEKHREREREKNEEKDEERRKGGEEGRGRIDTTQHGRAHLLSLLSLLFLWYEDDGMR